MAENGSDRAPRIEQFALVGDCETAALVASDGCIDWLCWPRFDSDACFAGLLGDRDHGHWRIGPVGEARSTRSYRGDTLILETTFETPDGIVRLVDFMPPPRQGVGRGPPRRRRPRPRPDADGTDDPVSATAASCPG
jgi:GH15 family glucan-1,4-alpha-glucosidase